MAHPRPYLGSKTLWTFPSPSLPVTALFAPPTRPQAPVTQTVLLDDTRVTRGKFSMLERGLVREAGRPGGGTYNDLIFDADASQWHGDLGAYLREKTSAGVKHLRVRVIGSGSRQCSPVRLPDGLTLEIRVDPPAGKDAEWLFWSAEPETTGGALIELRGGTLVLSDLRLKADERSAIESLIRVESGDLVLDRCQLIAPPASGARTRRLVSFEVPGTRPHRRPEIPGLFSADPDKPVCALSQCILITPTVGLRAEVGRGLVALSQCTVAAGTDAIQLDPGRVARGRFEADLWLGHCTLLSEQNLIRLGPWPGLEPGPVRPWLITTDHNAFLGTYDRRVSETTLLRVDEEAMAGGTVFWQATGDAYEVDAFTAAGAEPPPNRLQDTLLQWINFWGGNHIREVTGPHLGSNHPTVRLYERPRPGRVEPADLILDPTYFPFRSRLDVGADLPQMGISPKSAAGGRRH